MYGFDVLLIHVYLRSGSVFKLKVVRVGYYTCVRVTIHYCFTPRALKHMHFNKIKVNGLFQFEIRK